MTWDEWMTLKASLYLQPHHECEASDRGDAYLEPPHHGTNGKVKLDDGRRPEMWPADYWILRLGIDDVDVAYCPWCGEKLPT